MIFYYFQVSMHCFYNLSVLSPLSPPADSFSLLLPLPPLPTVCTLYIVRLPTGKLTTIKALDSPAVAHEAASVFCLSLHWNQIPQWVWQAVDGPLLHLAKTTLAFQSLSGPHLPCDGFAGPSPQAHEFFWVGPIVCAFLHPLSTFHLMRCLRKT